MLIKAQHIEYLRLQLAIYILELFCCHLRTFVIFWRLIRPLLRKILIYHPYLFGLSKCFMTLAQHVANISFFWSFNNEVPDW